MKSNYELDVATMFTDMDGNQISVGAYSSLQLPILIMTVLMK